jgi:hypothetical protein
MKANSWKLWKPNNLNFVQERVNCTHLLDSLVFRGGQTNCASEILEAWNNYGLLWIQIGHIQNLRGGVLEFFVFPLNPKPLAIPKFEDQRRSWQAQC